MEAKNPSRETKIVDDTPSNAAPDVWEKLAVIRDYENVESQWTLLLALQLVESVKRHYSHKLDTSCAVPTDRYLSKSTNSQTAKMGGEEGHDPVSSKICVPEHQIVWNCVCGDGFSGFDWHLCLSWPCGSSAASTWSDNSIMQTDKVCKGRFSELRMQLTDGSYFEHVDRWLLQHRLYLCHFALPQQHMGADWVLCTSEWDKTLCKMADNHHHVSTAWMQFWWVFLQRCKGANKGPHCQYVLHSGTCSEHSAPRHPWKTCWRWFLWQRSICQSQPVRGHQCSSGGARRRGKPPD